MRKEWKVKWTQLVKTKTLKTILFIVVLKLKELNFLYANGKFYCQLLVLILATVSTEEITNSSKGFVPKNTSKSTGLAYCVFQQWIQQHNTRLVEKYPDDLLDREVVYDCDIISGCLQRFVVLTRSLIIDCGALKFPCWGITTNHWGITTRSKVTTGV